MLLESSTSILELVQCFLTHRDWIFKPLLSSQKSRENFHQWRKTNSFTCLPYKTANGACVKGQGIGVLLLMKVIV